MWNCHVCPVEKRQCTYEVMTPYLIGTCVSTNCHIFGTKFYRTHHHSTSKSTAHHPPLPAHGPTPHKCTTQHMGAHTISILVSISYGGGTFPIPFHIYNTFPYTPNTQTPPTPITPLHPHFSSNIFGNYTHLFM